MIALFCACLRDGDGRGLGGDVNVTHCLNVGTWSPTHHLPPPPLFFLLLLFSKHSPACHNPPPVDYR